MILRLLLAVAAVATPSAATTQSALGQTGTLATLRTKTPQQLGAMLHGERGKAMAEASIEVDSNARYPGVWVRLASRARSSGWSDLCEVDEGSVFYHSKEGVSGGDTPLRVSVGGIVTRYILLSSTPRLARVVPASPEAEACSRATPLLGQDAPGLLTILPATEFPGADAALAVRLFVAAQQGAGRIPVWGYECGSSAEGGCADPARHFAGRNLQDADGLRFYRCDKVHLCLEAHFGGAHNPGTERYVILLESFAGPLSPDTPPAIRSVHMLFTDPPEI